MSEEDERIVDAMMERARKAVTPRGGNCPVHLQLIPCFGCHHELSLRIEDPEVAALKAEVARLRTLVVRLGRRIEATSGWVGGESDPMKEAVREVAALGTAEGP